MEKANHSTLVRATDDRMVSTRQIVSIKCCNSSITCAKLSITSPVEKLTKVYPVSVIFMLDMRVIELTNGRPKTSRRP